MRGWVCATVSVCLSATADECVCVHFFLRKKYECVCHYEDIYLIVFTSLHGKVFFSLTIDFNCIFVFSVLSINGKMELQS